jgi:heme iron utilization protein
VHQARAGTMATLSRKHAGHPFASLMPYALDSEGRPLLLISAMAVHTQNLQGDPRASLLVTQPDVSGEPLAGGRVTLMGEAGQVREDQAAARETYLARQPTARYWADFGDFALWRLEIRDLYFVAGFGAMGWVDPRQYREARPDPLLDAAPGILDHMNRDHADALRAYARFFAGVEAEEATMAAVDRLGFKLRLRQGPRRWSVRIAFPREVTTAAESRTALIEMLQQAEGTRQLP